MANEYIIFIKAVVYTIGKISAFIYNTRNDCFVGKNEFFPDRGFGKLRYSKANEAIREYKKLTSNLELIAKLMFYYTEIGIKFIREYGDIDEKFYINIEKSYINALDYVQKYDLQEIFADQAHEIKVKASGIGWGFGDNMSDIYYEYYYDDIN